MKKIIVAVMLMLMSVSSVYAGSHALKHANPLPNLMRITLGNAELLNLDKGQVKALKTYAKANRPKVKELVKKVMAQEKMLLQESLGADKDVVKKSEAMFDTRREIIQMKTTCRAFLKNTLSEKQYAQVISIYKSVR